MPVMHDVATVLQAFVAASIFFVWVVRYATTSLDFKQMGLPDSLRDLVGILKLTCSLLLLIGIARPMMAFVGGIGIVGLMGAAVVMHLRIRNPPFKMLPALTLLVCAGLIAWLNYLMLRA